MTLSLMAASKPTRRPSPAVVGRRVLLGLQKGRDKINGERKARGEFWLRIIAEYALLDAQGGHGTRGRAGRIARKMKGRLSERWIHKYLVLLSSKTNSKG